MGHVKWSVRRRIKASCTESSGVLFIDTRQVQSTRIFCRCGKTTKRRPQSVIVKTGIYLEAVLQTVCVSFCKTPTSCETLKISWECLWPATDISHAVTHDCHLGWADCWRSNVPYNVTCVMCNVITHLMKLLSRRRIYFKSSSRHTQRPSCYSSFPRSSSGYADPGHCGYNALRSIIFILGLWSFCRCFWQTYVIQSRNDRLSLKSWSLLRYYLVNVQWPSI